MYDLSNHIILRQCQRSFDVETPVDQTTLDILKNITQSFISNNNLTINSHFITDIHEIKLIHSSAMIENEPFGLEWKTNTQVYAPLLILCQALKNGDSISNGQIGRLYAKLGLAAIERGYQTGFCLCINPKVLDAWNLTQKYTLVDPSTGKYIPPIFLSIGKPLDPTQPYNKSLMHEKYNPSHTRYIDFNIRVKVNP